MMQNCMGKTLGIHILRQTCQAISITRETLVHPVLSLLSVYDYHLLTLSCIQVKSVGYCYRDTIYFG